MRLMFRVFSVGLAIAVLVSCSDDSVSDPATITCSFVSQSETAMSGMLTLERIDLNLAEVDISGRRTSGGEIFFTRTFSKQTGYFPTLDNMPPTSVFQVPQGSYSSFVFYTTLREEDYDFESGSIEGEDDETNNLVEYVEKARPGLLIVARYVNGATEFPVIISLNDDISRFAVEATQGGTGSVVLYKDEPATATFTLDPQFLFSTISTATLEAAMKFPLNSEQAVMISEDYNESLYNQLAVRMQGAVSLTIDE